MPSSPPSPRRLELSEEGESQHGLGEDTELRLERGLVLAMGHAGL